MGSTHPHRGRRPGGRHSRENPGSSAPGGPRGPSPNSPNGSAPSTPRPAAASPGGVGAERAGPAPRAPAGPRDLPPAARAGRIPGYAGFNGGNGRSPSAAPLPDGFAVMAPTPWPEARPRPPLDAPARRGRHMPGEARPATPDVGAAPWLPRSGASNSHQPSFATMPPASPAESASDDTGTNGSGHSAEAQSWPRADRLDRGQDQAERPPLRPGVRGEVGPLIEALHEIFERDRATASQGNAARCGICYLHHPRAELVYREAEGFYVCATCAALLGTAELNMVRRQQK